MMVKKNILHLNQQELESVNVSLQLSNTDTPSVDLSTNMESNHNNLEVYETSPVDEPVTDMNSNTNSERGPETFNVAKPNSKDISENKRESQSQRLPAAAAGSDFNAELAADSLFSPSTAADDENRQRPSLNDIFQKLSSQTDSLDIEPKTAELLSVMLHNGTPETVADQGNSLNIQFKSPSAGKSEQETVKVQVCSLAHIMANFSSKLAQRSTPLMDFRKFIGVNTPIFLVHIVTFHKKTPSFCRLTYFKPQLSPA